LIIDFIIKLLLSYCGAYIYNIILIVIDYYTKIVRYIPITKNLTTINLANIFIYKII
ncbi:hypothetical protein K469DRAFT_584277, partial [Zopfia rhizophila CBS 207.26]